MPIITALATLATLTNTISSLAAGAAQISALIQKAHAEGRTEFTPDEWAVIQGADTAARDVLADAIVAALRSPK